MLSKIDSRVLTYASIAAVASACAAAGLIVLESSLAAFVFGITVLSLLLIGCIRTEWLLFLVLLSGIFYTPLERFSSRVFGILVIPTDAIFLLWTVIMLVKTLGRVRSAKPINEIQRLSRDAKLAKIVTGIFLLVFFTATMVGLFRGHYWQTAFTEVKLCLYYGAIPLIVGVFATRKVRLETFMLLLVVASAIGSLYDLYARMFDIYTVSAYMGGVEGAVAYADTRFGDIIRDYGWVSTFHYQVFSVLISLAFVLHPGRILSRLAWLGLLLINAVANLLTVTRGFMLALLVGVFAVILLSSIAAGETRRILWGKLIGRVTIGIVLLATVFSVVGQVIPQANAAFDRLYGVLNRSYAGRGDAANTKFRLESVQTGLTNALEQPLGMGFGTKSPTSHLSASEAWMVTLMTHNSIGYMLYKFGFPGTAAILGMFALLFFKLLGLIRRVGAPDKLVPVALFSCLLALFGMSFTSGNFLFNIGSLLPFVVFMIAGVLYCVERNAWERDL